MKMKKKKGVGITILILAVLWIIGMTGCQKKTEKVIEDIGESSVFTKEEREEAIKCVRDNFSFEGATLKKVWYEENNSKKFVSSKEMDSENTIVVLSDFYVDKSGKNPVLNPGTLYENYNWILTRDSKSDDWEIVDQGY